MGAMLGIGGATPCIGVAALCIVCSILGMPTSIGGDAAFGLNVRQQHTAKGAELETVASAYVGADGGAVATMPDATRPAGGGEALALPVVMLVSGIPDCACGKVAYGKGTYGNGVYGKGVYAKGAYGSGAYGDGAYGDGAYGKGAYVAGATVAVCVFEATVPAGEALAGKATMAAT